MSDNQDEQTRLAKEVLAGQRQILSSTPKIEGMAEIPDNVKAIVNERLASPLPSKAFGQPTPPLHDASKMADPYDTKTLEALRAQKMRDAQEAKTPTPTKQPEQG